MIEWRSEGVLIAARRHAESAAIIDVFTPDHGRASGVVRGGGGRRMAPILQPGAQLDVTWRARLDEHLGHFTVEPIRSRAAQTLGGRMALAGLGAICAMIGYACPDRAPMPDFYARTVRLFDLLGQDDVWPLAYAQWEAALLDQLGFGLDLEQCAVTGSRTDLRYISPKTGRAVSVQGAGDWAPKLLPLSPALIGAVCDDADIIAALDVTGHFLRVHLGAAVEKDLPAARARLTALLA